MLARRVRAGYLFRQGDDWYIRPAQLPGNLGLQCRDPYLKIKECRIGEGAVPGLKRFGDPDYQAGYHEISFNAKTIHGKHGPVTIVTEIGPPSADYSHAGVLVCSGNMLETAGADQESPRRQHVIVLERDTSAEPLKLEAQAVRDYLGSLTEFQKQEPAFSSSNGCLIEDRPVFYVPQGKSVSVRYFGHCPNFRVPAWSESLGRCLTPRDLVPAEVRRAQDIDLAEALFGFIRTPDQLKAIYGEDEDGWPRQGSISRAYAGRVRVTDAELMPGQGDVRSEVIEPSILASPKPTCYPHYLEQISAGPAELKHYGSPGARVRGHKLYWHRGEMSVDSLHVRYPTGDAERDSQLRGQFTEVSRGVWRVKDDSEQYTRIRPVKPHTKFRFCIHFENFNGAELGSLCWALDPLGPDGQRTYCHTLGMGKLLGMGAVRLRATLYLEDVRARYGVAFASDRPAWESGLRAGEDLSSRQNLAGRVEAFERKVIGDLDETCTHIHELQRIQMLLKLLEWEGPSPEQTETMLLSEFGDRRVLPDPSAEVFVSSGRSKSQIIASIERIQSTGHFSQVGAILDDIESTPNTAVRLELAQRLRERVNSSQLRRAWTQQLTNRTRLEKLLEA